MNLSASFVAAAMAVAPQPAFAPSATQIAGFESAMAQADYHRAEHLADDMIRSRRRAMAPFGPDPLLNGLIGRLALGMGKAPLALGYLEHTAGAGVPERQRVAADVALAAAREQVGDYEGARTALDKLSGDALTAEEKQGATLERARLLLLSDPAAAITLVQPLTGWEADTIVAQAQSLLGNGAAAREAGNRAWMAAAQAPPQDYASLRVALIRAGLAGAAGDRVSQVAMLNAGAVAGSRVDATLVNILPICGERGVTPADAVTFTLFEGSNGNDELSPVAAMRPTAVAVFADALAGRNLLEHDGEGPGGTLITVRCRPFIAANYVPPPREADPWSTLAAGHGLYEEIASDGSLEEINALSAELDTLSRSLGDDDPRLIPLRTQLARWLAARAQKEGDVQDWQVTELERKAELGIAKLGGESLYLSVEDLAAAQAIKNAPSPEEGVRLYREAMLRRAATLPLDQAYPQTLAWLDEDKDMSSEAKRSAIAALLNRLGSNSADLRRRALLVRLGRTQKDQDLNAARASWRAAGVPADIGFTLDGNPKVEDNPITDEDYPGDALEFAIEGKTVFDAMIGPDGHVRDVRLLLSTPAPLFDAIAAKLPDFKISAPSSGGKPRACRGFIQTIQWKMPDRNQDQDHSGEPRLRLPQKDSA